MPKGGSLLHLAGRERVKTGSKLTLNTMKGENNSWASRIFPKQRSLPLQLASFPLPGQMCYRWIAGSGAQIWAPEIAWGGIH